MLRRATTAGPLRPAARLLALAIALSAGCRGGEGGGAPPRPGDRYDVRGEIVRLPAPGASPREITIRHEAIPTFKAQGGATVGMKPMVMPFDVARAVRLEGLAAGDKVRFRFVMDWAGNASEVESIERLPPETVLDFGAP
jgi:hypothetical protein